MADYKKLYRSRDKKISGVCGGLADYFDVDPVILRVLWIILIFTPLTIFGIIIAYLICALVIPEEPVGYQEKKAEEAKKAKEAEEARKAEEAKKDEV